MASKQIYISSHFHAENNQKNYTQTPEDSNRCAILYTYNLRYTRYVCLRSRQFGTSAGHQSDGAEMPRH